MRNYLIFVFLLLVCGWRWDTHQNLAEAGLRSLPLDVQGKLNVTAMQEGSIAPDKDFHDNYYHRFPYSVELAGKWMQEAKSAYAAKDYEKASYAYGVASHYITDSFAAPHNVEKEEYSLHAWFERQADSFFPGNECVSVAYDLEDELWDAARKGHADWLEWMESKDRKIAHKEVEDAVLLVYKTMHSTFGTSCGNTVEVGEVKPKITPLSIALGISALLTLIVIFYLLITA